MRFVQFLFFEHALEPFSDTLLKDGYHHLLGIESRSHQCKEIICLIFCGFFNGSELPAELRDDLQAAAYGFLRMSFPGRSGSMGKSAFSSIQSLR